MLFGFQCIRTKGLAVNEENEPLIGQPTETSNLVGELLSYILIAAPFVASLALIGFQVYVWLRSGIWPQISVLDGMKYVSSNDWLVNPTDWTGLHSILSNGSLSAAFAIFGVAIFWLVMND
jgi:hypothetical protein